MIIVDALWRAKPGHFEKLDKLLNPRDTEAFLLAAGKMQHGWLTLYGLV